MNQTNCSKCQSNKIIPNVHIRDYGDYNSNNQLSVEVYEKPDAIIFKGAHPGALNAWICGECGYTELYVENPQELYLAYLSGDEE
jgi:predicted nucleic-acid-binding Zn-ribbon protein